jgi:uncharacterized membrane protein HdeD (DUF308 family)
MASTSTATTTWTVLLATGLLEVVRSSSMKASEGFTKHLYTGVTFVAAWFGFWLLRACSEVARCRYCVCIARIICITGIVGGILGLKALRTTGTLVS